MPINILSNTIAFNQFGLTEILPETSPLLAIVASNIFYQNHDLTPSRNGAAIVSYAANKTIVRSNLFSGNGRARRVRPTTRSASAAASTRRSWDPRVTPSATSPATRHS